MKNNNINKNGLEALSLRARNSLASAKIYTLQDLIGFCKEYGIEALRRIRKLGPRTFIEIEDFLESVPYDARNFVVHPKSNFFAIKDFVYANKDIQNTPIQNIKFIPTRAKRILTTKGISTLKDLIEFCEKYGFESLLRFRDFGKKTLFDLRYVLDPTDNYLDNAIKELKNINTPEDIDADDNEVYLLSEVQLTQTEKIQKLESDIKNYKLAIARTKAKIAQLKKAQKINKETEEPQR